MATRSKRGTTNLVLMLGIVISMATLLIGGGLVTIKLVEGQARAGPEFIATTLTSTISLMQAAPESATFNYYTEQDDNGFPLIGSLEIDDDNGILCVSKKTEDEIMGTITDKTAIAAGFGGVGYAYDKYRTEVAKRSARRAIEDEKSFGPQMRSLNTKTKYALGSNTKDGDIARRYVSGDKLNNAETGQLQKYFKKNPEIAKDLRVHRKLIQKAEQDIFAGRGTAEQLPLLGLKNRLKATKAPATLFEKIKAKIPYTEAWKRSKLGARFMAYAQLSGEAKLLTRVGTTLKTIIKSPLKLTAAPSVGRKYAVVGGLIAFQYFVSGGDWEQTGIFAAQLTIMGFGPKLVEWIVVRGVKKYAVVDLAARGIINRVFAYIKSALSSVPVVGTAACLAVHGGEAAINIVWSVWDTFTFDVWMIKMFDGASDAVNAEKNAKACKNFNTGGETLLSPPNCQPRAKMQAPFDELAHRTAIVGGYGVAAGALTTAVPLAIAGATCMPGVTAVAANVGMVSVITAVGGTSVATVALTDAIRQNPTGMIPRSTCEEDVSCDTAYARMDCPNWFISDSGEWVDVAGGATFAPLMYGGPACAALSVFGWASMACNGARVLYAVTAFFAAPDKVFSYVLQGNKVGFVKGSIGKKSALGLTNEFADNDGFWYAELPYTVEITKVYTDDAEKRNSLVIRKV